MNTTTDARCLPANVLLRIFNLAGAEYGRGTSCIAQQSQAKAIRTEFDDKNVHSNAIVVITEVPELQDVKGPKRIAPPPSGQTTGLKWTIFGRDKP